MITTCALRKKHKSSEVHSASSADIIGSNEDLINQILLCIPVQSLVRFKSVSKQWNSLISNRRFCLTHTLKHPCPRIPSGLFFRFPTASTVYSVFLSKTRGKIPSFPHRFHDLKEIVQSCNGLNLFRIEQRYYVRNLATNQDQIVPFPTLYPSARDRAWFLSFDPSVSSHYKILCVQVVEDSNNKFLIFSSETGRWKDTGVTTYNSDWWWKSAVTGVYLQGAIHCLSYKFSPLKTCYRFDVEAENLTKISWPSSPDFSPARIRYFGEFNGYLHVVCSFKSKKILHVLELDSVRQMLFRKYEVSIDGLISQFPEARKVTYLNKNNTKSYEYGFSILSVVRGAKEEDPAIVMAIPGKVVSYNGKSMKSEVLSELPLGRKEIIAYVDFRNQAFDFPFIPTLHPV